LGKFFTKIRHITKLAQNGQIFTKIRHISKLAQNGQMLYENSWAIRLIAALLLNFMSHIRPVPSPQRGFAGLSPPKQCTKPPKLKYENYRLVDFVNFYNAKASTGKQKTHSNHNVGWFSTQTHTYYNVGWFSPELTLTIMSGDFHPNSQSSHSVGWFSPKDHLATTPVRVEIARG